MTKINSRSSLYHGSYSLYDRGTPSQRLTPKTTALGIYQQTLQQNLLPDSSNPICRYTSRPTATPSESVFAPYCMINPKKSENSKFFDNNLEPFTSIKTDLYEDYYSNPLDFNEKSVISYFNHEFTLVPDFRKPQEIYRWENLYTTPTAISWHGSYKILMGDRDPIGLLKLADLEANSNTAYKFSHTNYRLAEGIIERILPFNENVISTICLREYESDPCSVNFHDLRTKKTTARYTQAARFCSIAREETMEPIMYATGDNDDLVKVWDLRQQQTPVFTIQHKSGIKALAFNPDNPTFLASGGGTNDKSVKITDLKTKKTITELDVGSQVCNLNWHQYGQYLVVGLGFNNSSIKVLDYRRKKLWECCTIPTAHTFRTTYTGNGTRAVRNVYVSAGSDVVTFENRIKFWKFFTKIDKNVSSLNRHVFVI